MALRLTSIVSFFLIYSLSTIIYSCHNSYVNSEEFIGDWDGEYVCPEIPETKTEDLVTIKQGNGSSDFLVSLHRNSLNPSENIKATLVNDAIVFSEESDGKTVSKNAFSVKNGVLSLKVETNLFGNISCQGNYKKAILQKTSIEKYDKDANDFANISVDPKNKKPNGGEKLQQIQIGQDLNQVRAILGTLPYRKKSNSRLTWNFENPADTLIVDIASGKNESSLSSANGNKNPIAKKAVSKINEQWKKSQSLSVKSAEDIVGRKADKKQFNYSIFWHSNNDKCFVIDFSSGKVYKKEEQQCY